MKVYMKTEKLLKWLIIIGGSFEIFLGISFIIINPFLSIVNIENNILFTNIAGLFLTGYGILLVYSAKDIKTYIIIPIINIFLRIIMIIMTLFNLTTYPEFTVIYIFAVLYDSGWSIVVIYSILRLNYISLKKP